jgi:hypothetical protein
MAKRGQLCGCFGNRIVGRCDKEKAAGGELAEFG